MSCASVTPTASSTRCSLPSKVTYEDLARASSDTSSAEPPSILKSIFHDTSGNDGLLAAWLVSDARDADIEAKEASRELTKLVRSRLGLELPEDAGLAKLRAVTLRYVLAGEFRSDLELRAADEPRRRTGAEDEGRRSRGARARASASHELLRGLSGDGRSSGGRARASQREGPGRVPRIDRHVPLRGSERFSRTAARSLP